ncbi:MAG: zinc-ribbon domain-containing protein, partial [Bacteroidetes bacterium]|nr:zinc-ribbon domain-containing protein [Bacteroidota bacterium]
MTKEWHPTKNGNKKATDFTSMSGELVWWLCKDCLYEWPAQIKNRTLLNSRCPLCSRDNGVIEYKKNRYLNDEELEPDYSYETEERLYLQEKQIQSI